MRCIAFRLMPVLAVGALGLAACGENAAPTQPDVSADPLTGVTLAAVRNTWTERAPAPFGPEFYGFELGTAPNAAGQTIVYALGGTDGEGGSGFGVRTYNVATNTWAGRQSDVDPFHVNGVGKIGNKLYFVGGWTYGVGFKAPLKSMFAYDYTHDRMIRKADLPNFTAEGVSGVINGKLYVLPGLCSGDGPIAQGYCEEEPSKRFFRYDPGTNTWQALAPSPHFHRRGAAAVIGGQLYVVGGTQGPGGNDPVVALDVYDPASNTWRTRAHLPAGGITSGAALGNRFYVVVSGPVIRAYAYDPSTNKWTSRAAPDFFGPVVRVKLGGKSRLFTASGTRSALYTP